MNDEDRLRSISVDSLNLSARAKHALHRDGRHTVFDMLSATEEELLRIPNTGQKTISEILQKIAEFQTTKEIDSPAAIIVTTADASKIPDQDRLASFVSGETIDVLGLPVRAYNILCLNDCETLSSVLFLTKEELLDLSRMDTQTAGTIHRLCQEYLAVLREKLPPVSPQPPLPDLMVLIRLPENREIVLDFVKAHDLPVETLGMNVRAINQLKANGFHTLSQILFLSPSTLQSIRSIGAGTVQNILLRCEDWAKSHETELRAVLVGKPIPESVTEDLYSLICLPQNQQAVLAYLQSHDQPVENLGMNHRAISQLKLNGYHTLSQILFLAPASLQDIRNMGAGTVQSVLDSRERWLTEYEAQLRAVVAGEPIPLRILPDDEICLQLLKLYEPSPDIGFSRQDYAEKLPEIPDDQRDRCIGRLLAERRLEYVDYRCYRVFPNYADAVSECPKLDDREKEIVLRRLRGETLESVAQSFSLTRERVRQIISRQHRKIQAWNTAHTGMQQFDEDFYLYFYETYWFEKQDAEQWLGLTTPVLRYLDLIAASRGKRALEEAQDDPKLSASLRQRIRNYLNRNKLFLDGQWLPRQRDALEQYVVTHLCAEDTTFEDFCRLYNDFLREQNISPDEGLDITDATVNTRKNRLRDSRFLLWKHGERLRAYDIDGRDYTALLDELGLAELENIEISTSKLLEEHPEILARYDIRDQYELHNLLRKLVPDGSWHGIKFGRAPMLLFGTFDRNAALRELMISHTPISQTELIELIHKEYGYDPGAIIWSSLADYYHQGMYTIEQKVMTEPHRKALLAELSGDFFFFDELRQAYLRCVPGSDVDEINPYNLKQMGFAVLSRYALRNYDNLGSFFQALLTREEFTDLRPLRHRYGYVLMFSQTLMDLKRALEVLEYEPEKLVRFSRLAAAGVTKQDLRDFCDAVYDYVEDGAWFSAVSLRQAGFDAPLYELGFSDWFYGCLLSTDARFGWSQIYRSIILHKGNEEVTVRSFETALIRAVGSLDVYDMQRILEETYGCTVPDRLDLIYKVAGSGVYYDKHLDRLYESENRYWRDVNEAEAQL